MSKFVGLKATERWVLLSTIVLAVVGIGLWQCLKFKKEVPPSHSELVIKQPGAASAENSVQSNSAAVTAEVWPKKFAVKLSASFEDVGQKTNQTTQTTATQ